MSDRVLKRHMNGPGVYAVNVVGESHYQENIRSIINNIRPIPVGEYTSVEATARILSEPNNEFDANAIRVDVAGLTVGYLSRDMAQRVGRQLAKAGFAQIDSTCNAKIAGVHDEGHPCGAFGVRLDIFTKGQKRVAEGKVVIETFRVVLVSSRHIGDETVAGIGDRVKLWCPVGDPSKVFVYSTREMPGEILGRVPLDQVVPIHKHLETGGQCTAAIAGVSAKGWEICGRLIPEAETKESYRVAEEQRRARLQGVLATRYRPRKPVQLAFVVNAKAFQRSEKMTLVSIPRPDELLDADGNRQITIRSNRSGKLYQCTTDDEVLRKLVRLQRPLEELEIQIVSKTREDNGLARYCADISP